MSGARGRGGGGTNAAAVLRRNKKDDENPSERQRLLGNMSAQAAFTDNVFIPRSFQTENGLGGYTYPIIPTAREGDGKDAQRNRLAHNTKVVMQTWGSSTSGSAGTAAAGGASASTAAVGGAKDSCSGRQNKFATTGGALWPTAAHPDDVRRSTGSSAVPSSRFPAELSERGKPLRRPKLKIPVGAELKLRNVAGAAAAAANRRRQRPNDDADDEDDAKRKKGAVGEGAGKGGDDDGAASVASNSDQDASSDSDDYSNHVPSDDDDGENDDNFDDGELAF